MELPAFKNPHSNSCFTTPQRSLSAFCIFFLTKGVIGLGAGAYGETGRGIQEYHALIANHASAIRDSAVSSTTPYYNRFSCCHGADDAYARIYGYFKRQLARVYFALRAPSRRVWWVDFGVMVWGVMRAASPMGFYDFVRVVESWFFFFFFDPRF